MQVTSVMNKTFDITVGMEIFVPCRNRGGHGAWVEVTKVNKKSFKAVERKGSYTPGTQWSVHKDATYAIVERGPAFGWHKHWINDN